MSANTKMFVISCEKKKGREGTTDGFAVVSSSESSAAVAITSQQSVILYSIAKKIREIICSTQIHGTNFL
jgi:hypothetical protein